jgi:hypothetical protein
MTLKKTVLGLAAALAVLGTLPAHAQSSKEIDELRQEIRKLREELNALKQQKGEAAKPADGTNWGERIEQVELKQKDAVVAGDIAGGFRLPGSETSVHLYGYAEAHAIHDFEGWGSPDNFTNLSGQPLKGSDPQKGRTKFTAETSRFGIETSTPTQHGTFNTKIEADFYAYDNKNGLRNRLRLRHAYGEYAGWLIGQTWSTFMDLDDLPETVDFNGPIGSPFSRRTMVRYTYGDAKAGYKFTFAAEDPEDQFGGGSANERMPELVARFDKSFDWGAINIRGLVHEKRSSTVSAPSTYKRGYGFGVGGSYKLTDKDLLMGQFARVDGDVDQMYGSNGYIIDADQRDAAGNLTYAGSGAITFDHNYGLVVGYAKTFSDQLRGNLVFGMNKSKVNLGTTSNKTLQQLHVDMIYSPIKNVELGAEYVYGRRKTWGDATGNNADTGTMSRFDLMGRYSF